MYIYVDSFKNNYIPINNNLMLPKPCSAITNPDFLIPISLQHNVVYFRYCEL